MDRKTFPTCNPVVKANERREMNDDMISRASVIDVVQKNTFRLTFAEEQNCEGHVAWSANAVYSDVIEGALKELPSEQPEIIWCKECKHWFDIDDGRQLHKMCADICGDWFCADAERRTDD